MNKLHQCHEQTTPMLSPNHTSVTHKPHQFYARTTSMLNTNNTDVMHKPHKWYARNTPMLCTNNTNIMHKPHQCYALWQYALMQFTIPTNTHINVHECYAKTNQWCPQISAMLYRKNTIWKYKKKMSIWWENIFCRNFVI